MTSVLLVDDHRLVRAGLAALLAATEDIEVVGEAADGDQAVRLATETRPDVVLMDLRMPVLDGAAATARLADELPSARVLVLTTYADDDSIAGALRAGALGYLTKDAGRRELLAAVRAAAEGQAVFDAAVRARLVAGFTRAAAAPAASAPTDPAALRSRFPGLTAREAEVLSLMAQGLPNPRIAGDLFLSPTTVKSYVNDLFAKLGVTSRGEAIALVLAG
jgi:DNA-binding NarL/FixJ family response regulator